MLLSPSGNAYYTLTTLQPEDQGAWYPTEDALGCFGLTRSLTDHHGFLHDLLFHALRGPYLVRLSRLLLLPAEGREGPAESRPTQLKTLKVS